MPPRYTEQADPIEVSKPVLICILACSLAFHAITLERSIFLFHENRKSSQWSTEPVTIAVSPRGGRKRGNRQTVTDGQTHTL